MLTSTVLRPGQLSIMRTGNSATDTPRCAALERLQQLGVSGILDARRGQGLLVDRRSHHGARLTLQRGLGRPFDAIGGCASG